VRGEHCLPWTCGLYWRLQGLLEKGPVDQLGSCHMDLGDSKGRRRDKASQLQLTVLLS
jgi:hypothetical protein